MRTSENTGQLAKAKAAAQAEMKNAVLNAVNPHFKNRYADLASVRDAVVPPLARHGISVTQTTDMIERPEGAELFVLATRLTHSSGEWEESLYPLTVGLPQAMGSQLTYARRYTLSAIAGISADEDDDAEIAHKEGTNNITEAEVAAIQKLVVEADADLPKFLKAVDAKSIDTIPPQRYEAAVGLLNKKIAATAKKEKPDATGNT